jgi:hypothetical protein
MATTKAKRSILAAQPRRRRTHPETQPETFIPVKAHVYRTIGELNGGFEKVLQDLQTLARISLFRANGLAATHSLISRIRAQVNRGLSETLHDREVASASHFDRLWAEIESAVCSGQAVVGKRSVSGPQL